MQIAIDLPNDFVGMQTEQVIAKEMRRAYALALFKESRVSLAKAAELAGLDIYGFIAVCKAEQIEIIDTSRDELLREMKVFSETNARFWSLTAPRWSRWQPVTPCLCSISFSEP